MASNVVADLKKHNVHPDIIAAVVEGLRKAGLKVLSSAQRIDRYAFAGTSA